MIMVMVWVAIANTFTDGAIVMVTACAAAYHVSPAWQQCNKRTDQNTAMTAYSQAMAGYTIQAVKFREQICIPGLGKAIHSWAI